MLLFIRSSSSSSIPGSRRTHTILVMLLLNYVTQQHSLIPTINFPKSEQEPWWQVDHEEGGSRGQRGRFRGQRGTAPVVGVNKEFKSNHYDDIINLHSASL